MMTEALCMYYVLMDVELYSQPINQSINLPTTLRRIACAYVDTTCRDSPDYFIIFL